MTDNENLKRELIEKFFEEVTEWDILDQSWKLISNQVLEFIEKAFEKWIKEWENQRIIKEEEIYAWTLNRLDENKWVVRFWTDNKWKDVFLVTQAYLNS